MKIGIVTNLYPPISRGGAEQIASRITHELAQRGHELFVYSSMPPKGISSLSAERLTERNAADVYRIYPLNLYYMLNDFSFPFPLRALWHLIDMYSTATRFSLARIIKEEKPDVILTHNMKGLGLQAVRAVRASGARHIHTLHDVQLSVPSGLLIHGEENRWLNRSWLRTWYEGQMKRIFGSPDIVVSPSQFLLDFYQQRGFFPESKAVVLPNPAPIIDRIPRTARQPGPLRLLFAGQLEEHKGIRFLLETLSSMEVPFELHIAGEGSLSQEVADWSSRDAQVIYHGFVSLRHLFDLFDLCDVTVVPSLCYENSPTVIYESFRAGVPVIASDIGGVGELITHGENGYLFEPGNVDALKEAIRQFHAHQEQFLGASGQIQKTVASCSMKRYVDTLEALMKKEPTP